MLAYVKSRIGLRLFLIFTSVLIFCIFCVVTLSALYSRDFGKLVIHENQQYVESQAQTLLNEVTELRAQKFEAVFQRLSAYSRLNAQLAELQYLSAGSKQKQLIDVSTYLTRYPKTGIFYTDLSAPTMICYWGGPSIPPQVSNEINLLFPLSRALADAKENNPEVVASHLILTSGAGFYYPNNPDVYLLPPVSELDLRDTNNYVLANPENNPERRTVWVPVYFDDVGQGLITTITSPIYGTGDAFLGVAGLDIPLDRIHKDILADLPGDGSSQARQTISFLLNKRGKLIVFPQGQLEAFGIQAAVGSFKNSFDLIDKGLTDSTLPEVRALGEKILSSAEQSTQFELRGEPYIAASKLLPTNGWRLVTVIPQAAFLAPVEAIAKALSFKITTLVNQFYLTASLFLLASLVLTLFSLKRFLLQPLKKITSAAEQIRKGNLDIQLDINRTDEIGSLASTVNVMAGALRQGLQLEREYADELKTQVAAQTRELEQQKKALVQTLQTLEEDIVRRQKIEAELSQAKEAAEAANRAKANFLANMTHELRTPLIGVLGMNELLLQTPLSEQQRTMALTVQRSGENLLSLISDILDFSKIESANLTLNSIIFDLSELVEETSLLLAEQAFEKKLTLFCRVAPDARWEVRGDPMRLRQILLNLLSNAIKFTHKGEISVRLTILSHDEVTGRFLIEVEDTGIGMSSADQEKIFSPFVQIDSTTTRAFGGTGLGLAIVRQLVALMDGTLEIESRCGEGSKLRVVFDLPLLALHKPELPDGQSGCRVLLQKANLAERTVVEDMLRFLGQQVDGVMTAEDAWERLASDQRAADPFLLAIISIEDRLPDGSLLHEKILQAPQLRGLRLIGLCKRMSLSKGDYPGDLVLLEEPVTWTSLLAALGNFCSDRNQDPLMEQAGPSRAATELLGEADRSTLRLLVADDYIFTHELVRRYLDESGLVVDHAKTGHEALSLSNDTRYDLILMDCNMPGMDGLEASRLLRQQGYSGPIVALTAHVDQRIYDDCIAAGMNDYISKPFRRNELLEIVRKWLCAGGE